MNTPAPKPLRGLVNPAFYWVSVTLLIPNKSGLVWWPAEVQVPAGSSIEDAIAYCANIMAEDGCMAMTKLVTEVVGRARVIRRREPVVVSHGGYATITPLHVELFDAGQVPEGDPE